MSNDQPITQKKRFLELDALRGFAAVSVMSFHYSINYSETKLGWRFGFGVTGVDLFFIISGFVILLTIKSGGSWTRFLVNRLARIYPAYWVCVLITSFFVFIFEPEKYSFVNTAANLTMFPNYFKVENFDGSYWTLPIEVLFYVFMIILLLKKRVHHVILISFVFVISIFIFHWQGSNFPKIYFLLNKNVPLLNHFPLFFSGIIFYYMIFEGLRIGYWFYLIVNILVSLFLYGKVGVLFYFVSYGEYAIILLFYHAIFLLSIFGKLKFMIRKELLFFGSISYPLYLIHQFIGVNIIKFMCDKLGANIYLAILVAVLFSISIATVISKKIEIPYNQKIKEWYRLINITS